MLSQFSFLLIRNSNNASDCAMLQKSAAPACAMTDAGRQESMQERQIGACFRHRVAENCIEGFACQAQR